MMRLPAAACVARSDQLRHLECEMTLGFPVELGSPTAPMLSGGILAHVCAADRTIIPCSGQPVTHDDLIAVDAVRTIGLTQSDRAIVAPCIEAGFAEVTWKTPDGGGGTCARGWTAPACDEIP